MTKTEEVGEVSNAQPNAAQLCRPDTPASGRRSALFAPK
jgi:hypothetical protein